VQLLVDGIDADDVGLNASCTRIVPCNFCEADGVAHDVTCNRERSMFSCDYNGWADVPEDEREGIDVFEAAQSVPACSLMVLVLEPRLVVASEDGERRAA
jgi:hypothetical protein